MNDVKLVESQTEPTTKISSKKLVLISIGVTVLYQVENIKSGTDISFHKWSHAGNSIYFSFICELEEYPRMYRLFLDSGSFVHITEMKMDGN